MVTYTQNVPVEKTERYTVKEPIEKECEEINLTYELEWGDIKRTCVKEKCLGRYRACITTTPEGICEKYEELCEKYTCTTYQLDCKLNIKNTDEKEGTFRLKAYITNKNDAKTYIKNITINVSAQETVVWSANHTSNDPYGCWYKDFEPSKKTICENGYKTITREKTIIENQEINKQETTIKYKTLFQSLGFI